MKLYVVLSISQVAIHGVDKSLEKACISKGIEYVRLIDEEVVLDDLRAMNFDEPALLYRISLTAKSVAVEALLARLHAHKLTTIYYQQTNVHPRKTFRELSAQMVAGLNIIPTSIIDETWQLLNDNELNNRIERLGGFPVVVKTLGLSHGQGVSKIDSIKNFRIKLQTTDWREYEMIARKYLSSYRHFRLIIIDNSVVAAIEYHKPEDDFRTNATEEPIVTALEVVGLDDKVKNLALDAVKLRASLTGGVDILFDSEGSAFLAEVNVPCYFTRAEAPTGIDISSQLIDAMIRKQQKYEEENKK